MGAAAQERRSAGRGRGGGASPRTHPPLDLLKHAVGSSKQRLEAGRNQGKRVVTGGILRHQRLHKEGGGEDVHGSAARLAALALGLGREERGAGAWLDATTREIKKTI